MQETNLHFSPLSFDIWYIDIIYIECFVIAYLQPWFWHWLWPHQPHSAGLFYSSLSPLSLLLQLSGWSDHHTFQLGHGGPTQEWPKTKETVTSTCTLYNALNITIYLHKHYIWEELTRSPFIHTTLGAGSPLMGISKRSLFPATIVTVLSGKFKLSKCTLGGSAKMKSDHEKIENIWKGIKKNSEA